MLLCFYGNFFSVLCLQPRLPYISRQRAVLGRFSVFLSLGQGFISHSISAFGQNCQNAGVRCAMPPSEALHLFAALSIHSSGGRGRQDR